MTRSDFAGTGRVFSFTLAQYLKSKSAIAMMVLMIVLASVCTVIMVSSTAGMVPVSFNADRVVIINESGYNLRTEDIAGFTPELAGVDIAITEEDFAAVLRQLDSLPGSVALLIEKADDGGLSVTAHTGTGSTVNSYTTSVLSGAVTEALSLARWREAGIGDEQIKSAFTPFSVSSLSYNQYMNRQKDGLPGGESYFWVSYAYSIIVMMLVNFSTSYIVRSVVEEKASKLVELLMVSVKPLALLLGKILATMCFMVLNMFLLILSVAITVFVINNFTDMSLSPEILAAVGINLTSGGAGILLIPVVLISVVLGYLTFSIIGGIAGACCSNMEQIGAAVNIVSFLALFGYMTALFSSIFGSRELLAVFSLLPVVSIFVAPVTYASGIIGFGILFVSWLLQAAVVALLAAFGARVYGALLIHKGNRVGLRQLFSIAGDAKRGVQT
jgi:ABC-type Na+ efflux pump permease subunit